MRRSQRPRSNAQDPDFLYMPEREGEDPWEDAHPGRPHHTAYKRHEASQASHMQRAGKASGSMSVPCSTASLQGSFAVELGLNPACKKRRSAASAVLEAGPPSHPYIPHLRPVSPMVAGAAWQRHDAHAATSPSSFSRNSRSTSPSPQPFFSHQREVSWAGSAQDPEPFSHQAAHAAGSHPGTDSRCTNEPSRMTKLLLQQLRRKPTMSKGLRTAARKGSRLRPEPVQEASSSGSGRSMSHRRKGKPMRSTY